MGTGIADADGSLYRLISPLSMTLDPISSELGPLADSRPSKKIKLRQPKPLRLLSFPG